MKNKACKTCKYEDKAEDDEPCKRCFDSFCGKLFPQPSEWLSKQEGRKEWTGNFQVFFLNE